MKDYVCECHALYLVIQGQGDKMVNIANIWQSVILEVCITKTNPAPCMGEKLRKGKDEVYGQAYKRRDVTKRTIGQAKLLPMTFTVTDTGQFGDDVVFQVLWVLQHMAKIRVLKTLAELQQIF